MSITKRYLEGDPSIIGGRLSSEQVGAIIDAHTFRLPGRRRNTRGKYPLWDPFYEDCLHRAGKQLGIAGINVNGAMRYKTSADRDAVKALTETLWAETHAAFEARRKG
ncbi:MULTISPECIES: hypothetical protein [unclassified Devosia]|jgi:hypothetical protein|uniref:hypothetical protein n=1 Tax=unclassified Devosia TaxID=196773 RepID=UPI00086D4A08|nr:MULTISPECIES: hypothetical protein [unclassified Devosia]MBN9361763.1 hypothetical protein [Devosia sp.]ODS87619.1 MAG: hypothetical protein ABS47_11830 [Devosia sp. SCN 66-27]OJX26790.1 MAG: hypothetical protein BGO83_23385 [Devosia sp. 66-14]